MKSIMIINEEKTTLDELQSFLNQEEIEIIDASNSRIGINKLNEIENIDLILVNSKNPNSDEEALFSLSPHSNLSIDSIDENNFLKKPFTKEQFKFFIDNKI